MCALAQPRRQPTLMLAATRRWPHVRSTFKSSHHLDTTFHTTRHLALTLPAQANRACFFAAHGRQSRETRFSLYGHFAIERRARKRSRDSRMVGIPQLFADAAIGARNRNEISVRLTLRGSQASYWTKKVGGVPGSGGKTAEKDVHRGRPSCEGKGSRKPPRIDHLFPIFPTGRNDLRKQPKL